MSNQRRGNPPGHKEPVVESFSIPTEVEQKVELPPAVLNQSAFSVVRNNNMYQLVSIPLNKQTLETGTPVVLYESTDRWDVHGQFAYYTDTSFLLVEEMEK